MKHTAFSLSKLQLVLVVLITLLFLAGTLLGFSQNNSLLALVPFGLAIVFLTFVRSDWILMAIVFFAPISLPLQLFNDQLSFDMNLPTEPLLVLLLVIYMAKRIVERQVNIRILYHPVSVCIYVYLAWLFLTACASTMPIVSFKFLLVRLWFIASFYFLALHLFANPRKMIWYIVAYVCSFLIVVGFTWYNHSLTFFSQDGCYTPMVPFYNDHTSYGAVLAMLIPLLFAVRLAVRRDWNLTFIVMFVLTIILVATLFSYTRAAWVSLLFVFGFWWVLKLKISFRNMIIIGTVVLAIGIPVGSQMYLSMRTNSAKYSSNFASHFKSMGNLSSDASNRERINRWSCAWRMFKEKPVFGWGPGTYMFQYAPFQLSYQRTEISTNAATLGNAHSEYLGPLAEAGILGILTFLSIIIATIATAFKVYRKPIGIIARSWVVLLVLSLITYYLHGFMNDFLDMDKVAVLFWGVTAMIVAFDVYGFQNDVIDIS